MKLFLTVALLLALCGLAISEEIAGVNVPDAVSDLAAVPDVGDIAAEPVKDLIAPPSKLWCFWPLRVALDWVSDTCKVSLFNIKDKAAGAAAGFVTNAIEDKVTGEATDLVDSVVPTG